MATNILQVKFSTARSVISSPLYQYDYGQIIHIIGLNLPENFEAHFSNSQNSGDAETYLGTENFVTIPDKYLETGETIYCFIYLHNDTTDGETEYKIKIPVYKRPRRTTAEPTPEQVDLITQVISQLGRDATRAETAATQAEESAERAGQEIGQGGYIDASITDEQLIITLTNMDDMSFVMQDERLVVLYE